MAPWEQNQNRGSLRRTLESGLNVLLMLACLALVGGIAYTHFWPSRNLQSSIAGPPRGAKIAIPGVESTNSQRTLVLVLSTHCNFCTASGGFYRRLQEAARARSVPIVAVLPQPTNEAKLYLDNLGLSISVVKQATLASVSVTATPTLIMVNSEGVVTDSWTGQLSPDFEKDVISKL
jgi:hypothetical protein